MGTQLLKSCAQIVQEVQMAPTLVFQMK